LKWLSSLHISFDSPEHTAQYAQLATYLTSLGSTSTYVLDSPCGRWKAGHSDPDVDPDLDNPFPLNKGLTQGKPKSNIGKVVFFDPLIKTLNEVQKEYPFYIRCRGSQLGHQAPLCYADDLNAFAICTETPKEDNKVISAFAAMLEI
jgi:hypothetical protein